MIWIPMPNAWPMCAACKKPVERLTEIVVSQDNNGSFRCFVECHGDRELVEFKGISEIRRVHFTFGTEVFVPNRNGIAATRRQIDL